MTGATELGSAYRRQRSSSPGRPAGYKIGLTTSAGRATLGATEPVYGVLSEEAMLADGSMLEASGFADLMIEPELALIVGTTSIADLPPEHWVAAVAPALEIVDNRLGEGVPALEDLVADNVAAFGAVVGAPRRGAVAEMLDKARCRFGRAGELGEPVGVEALEPSPLAALAWLAKSLAVRGTALVPGQVVLTGSLTLPLRPLPGDFVTADFGPLGKLGVRVDADASYRKVQQCPNVEQEARR